jgi:hypothetical protein
MRTFYLLELVGTAHHHAAWRAAPDKDKAAAISLLVHLMEEAMKVHATPL